jgi:hypothetical protein
MKKLIKNITSFFKISRFNKYEVMSLMVHVDYKDERLKKAQEDGWQICGDILLKNEDGWCKSTFFHIPMKRKIN